MMMGKVNIGPLLCALATTFLAMQPSGARADVTTETQAQTAATTAPDVVKYFEEPLLPLPPTFQEAPELAERVRKGELPPVRERLPENPVVVEPVEEIGKYGGNWRKLAAANTDIQMNIRLGYEPLVRWDREGKNVIPNVAESWEVRDGGRTFVFHLRKGMRWSDGHPFTSEDFVFTFNDVLKYDNYIVLTLPWIRVDNELPEIEAPDAHTVIYRFPKPYGNFPKALASSGLQRELFAPSHYLKQFHEKFVDADKMQQMVREAGFVTWMDFFVYKVDLDRNKDLPTLTPFKTTQPYPSGRVVAERNPYYWKVDTAGNQLPYMDSMITTMVFDPTILNLKAMNGEADFQMRRIDASNFTMFKEKGRQLGYRTLVAPSTNPICIYVNLHSRNEKTRSLLQDVRFRKALSHAIDRQELVDMIFSGLAEPSSAVSIPEDPNFIEGMDKANIEYNPDLANALLDEIGMKRRAVDGLREWPDGELFSQILHVYPSEEGNNMDMWQLVIDYWREIGLHFTPKQDDSTLGFQLATTGNSDFFAYTSAALHWEVDGMWKSPTAVQSYMAPLYGLYYSSNGREGAKPPPDIQNLVDWYQQLRATPDDAERLRLGQNILKQWADQCYVVGLCRGPIVTIVSNRMGNVPDKINYDYRLKSPGYLGIEQFFIDDSRTGATP